MENFENTSKIIPWLPKALVITCLSHAGKNSV